MYDLSDALFGLSQKKKPGPFFFGRWEGPETVDSNLSQVTLSGDTTATRWIPKLKSVTGLVAGDGVLLIETGGGNKIIIGAITGDVSKAG